MERCQRQLWNPKDNDKIMLVRLRIFAQLKIRVMGSVSSKKKKREYLMKRKCSFIGAITEQSIQT